MCQFLNLFKRRWFWFFAFFVWLCCAVLFNLFNKQTNKQLINQPNKTKHNTIQQNKQANKQTQNKQLINQTSKQANKQLIYQTKQNKTKNNATQQNKTQRNTTKQIQTQNKPNQTKHKQSRPFLEPNSSNLQHLTRRSLLAVSLFVCLFICLT